jgi:hypothetical protein
MFLQRLSGDAPDPNESMFGPFYLPGGEMIPAGMPFVVAKLISACDPVEAHPRQNRPEA